MSVINQVLLDLDRRRASGAEREALPGHVRALPQIKDPNRIWRMSGMAALGIAGIGALAFALAGARPGSGLSERVEPVVAQANDAASERAVPGAVDGAEPAWRWASRLSLELSRVPVEAVDALPPKDNSRPAAPGRVLVATTDIVGPQPQSAALPATARTPATPGDSAAREPAPPLALAKVVSPPAGPVEIDKQTRKPTARDLADADYARGTSLMHQGRLAEAREALESTLRQSPRHHSARQALFGVLLEQRQHAEAEGLLQEGLRLSPAQPGFSMALARLQVERGDSNSGVDTLLKGLEHARDNADYAGFLAALLQRLQRHGEAVEHFQSALRLRPQHGVWLLGLGASQQALGRITDAQDAFRRAKAAGSLTPELQAYADQRLRQLQ